jgi:hypothetical protein
MREERGMKKKRATKSKAVRTLPSKSVSAKRGGAVKGGGTNTPEPYLQFNLEQAHVSSYSISSGGDKK